jgi:hypothetical protein
MGLGPADFDSKNKAFGYADVAVGDEIDDVFGSDVPLVLRQVQCEESNGLRKIYKLAGTCYVNGIMDGEAIIDEAIEGDEILLC